MPANHSSPVVHWMAGAYPGKIGWLVGPSARKKTKLQDWMPFALDNDAFSAFTNGKPWDLGEWLALIAWVKMTSRKPLWSIVPDSVGNKSETIRLWAQHVEVVKRSGWAAAFAVQDGMTCKDVPTDADVVFVGGSTQWKWKTAQMWCAEFPRVHIGRVNSLNRLILCEKFGAESVDGTGWFRDQSDQTKIPSLIRWMSGEATDMQIELFQ